jgi:hypothetical protein
MPKSRVFCARGYSTLARDWFSHKYDYNSKPVDSVLVTVVHLYLINFHHDVYLVATRLERSLKKYLNRCASLFI